MPHLYTRRSGITVTMTRNGAQTINYSPQGYTFSATTDIYNFSAPPLHRL